MVGGGRASGGAIAAAYDCMLNAPSGVAATVWTGSGIGLKSATVPSHVSTCGSDQSQHWQSSFATITVWRFSATLSGRDVPSDLIDRPSVSGSSTAPPTLCTSNAGSAGKSARVESMAAVKCD